MALRFEALVPHVASILYCRPLDISDRVVLFSIVHLSLLVSLFLISPVVFSSGIRMYLISVLSLSPQKIQDSSNPGAEQKASIVRGVS